MSKQRSRILNVPLFLNSLLSSLNAYEGNSAYFVYVNELLISYFKNAYVDLNEKEASVSLAKLQAHPLYKTHPFLIPLITILKGETLSSYYQLKLKNNLKEHPHYPLHHLLLKSTKLSKTNYKPSKKDLANPLFFVTYIQSLSQENVNTYFEYLNDYSGQGFGFASLTLAECYAYIQYDVNIVFEILNKAFAWAEESQNIYVAGALESIAKSLPFIEYSAKLRAKAAVLGNVGALSSSINYYQKLASSDESYYPILIHFLTLAINQNIEGSKEKLIEIYSQYKSNISNEEYLKFISDNY